ncbi:MAG TPA: polysaccharide deacetylase family protein [Acidimicrobiales bacterium]|nr:polysaccharide deacetylase family protein [Acidimicrobiales bacterium]
MTTLAERLGHPPTARLLIVNCDDLGVCHATNVGVYEALRDGIATSASLMVPCPWAREAAARYRGEDVGVHLTLNAEWEIYRWGPITHAPSLLDGDGGFPRTLEDVWDHADLDEVRRELRAQVERAILWGFDVSHLDSHLSALQRRPEFFDIYLELAVDFRLPVRLPSAATERDIGFPLRRLAEEEGVLFPDHFVATQGRPLRRVLERALFDLAPGVTEIQAHPAVDAPDLRALAPDWAVRVDDHDLLVHDHEVRALAARAGVQLIGYLELRQAMRSG